MIKNMMFKFMVVVLFTMIFFNDVDIQTISRIDPKQLKEIVYPSLTDREGKSLFTKNVNSENFLVNLNINAF